MRSYGKKPFRLLVAVLLHLSVSAASADVVPVVSTANPVESLSRIELENIFLGRTARLPTGEPIQPVDQQVGEARRAFYAEYLDKSPAQLRAFWSKMIFTGRGRPPKSVADGEAVKQWLAENPQAIGYLEESLVDGNLKVVSVPSSN